MKKVLVTMTDETARKYKLLKEHGGVHPEDWDSVVDSVFERFMDSLKRHVGIEGE